MKTSINSYLTVFLLLFFVSSSVVYSQEISPKPQKPEKIKKVLEKHGDKRIDYYYWMNERTNPKVINYLKAENEYTEAMMKHTEKLQ